MNHCTTCGHHRITETRTGPIIDRKEQCMRGAPLLPACPWHTSAAVMRVDGNRMDPR